jgi:O-antigen/teichoic acid export membrane protein
VTQAHARSRPSSLRLNVAANYGGKLWSIASVYLFVPVYVHLLGIAAYGLIAFYSVALAVLYIADAGLSSSFAREAARERDHARLGALLASTEWALIAILAAAGIVMALCSDFIAQRWLHDGGALPRDTAVACVRLMPLALVPQIAMALYFGGLMGLQRQVLANGVTTAFNVVRSGLVVVPLFFVRDPQLFFAWQAAAGWVFLLLARSLLRREIGLPAAGVGRFSWPTLQPIVAYAGGMFAMSIIAGLNTQLDRIVVSSLRPLEEFAWYSVCATLAQVPSFVTLPIAAALLPRLTELVESRQQAELTRLYEFNSYMIAAVGSSVAIALCLFGSDALALWMPQRQMPPALGTVVTLLAAGALFLALQLAPFQLSLANGHNRTNAQLGLAVLVVTVPMQVLLTRRYGLVGAAVPWLALNAFAFVYLGVRLNRRFYPGSTRRWFTAHCLPPVLVAGAVLGLAHAATASLHAQALPRCIAAAGASLLSVLAAYRLQPTFARTSIHA